MDSSSGECETGTGHKKAQKTQKQKPLSSPLLLVYLQQLVSAAAAICDVLEEVKLLLFPARPNDQPIKQRSFLEMYILNRVSLNPINAQAEHSLRHKHQTVIIDLQITH